MRIDTYGITDWLNMVFSNKSSTIHSSDSVNAGKIETAAS